MAKRTSENRRARHRRELIAEILTIARRQLESNGPGGVSWRGIAGDVGMDPASLYTYFDNLHALYTALIVDSHLALTAAIVVADGTVAEHDGSARVLACVRAYRQWALAHRGQFNLITTDAIPGYVAPADAPSLEAELEQGRVMLRALGVAIGHRYGELENLAVEEFSDLMGLSGLVHGLVALEVNHHMPFITDPERLLTAQVDRYVRGLREEIRAPECSPG